MRLTLRTLLAFMDEVLEPSNRDELAKKVEGSEFANDLIHRTKDTMRRLRLSAPQVLGTGIGLDPNTVAEYLDSELPPDSVADFERVCLESDVHLAEVASCHHVLTMVLGEPAEVDPASRQRMYALPDELERRKQLRIEGAHAALDSGRAVVPVVEPAVGAPAAASSTSEAWRRTVEIPDYLRASAWTKYRVPLMALAAMLLVAISVALVSGVARWFGDQPQLAADAGGTAADDQAASSPALPDSHESVTDQPANLTQETTAADSEIAALPTDIDGHVPPMSESHATAAILPPDGELAMPGDVGDSSARALGAAAQTGPVVPPAEIDGTPGAGLDTGPELPAETPAMRTDPSALAGSRDVADAIMSDAADVDDSAVGAAGSAAVEGDVVAAEPGPDGATAAASHAAAVDEQGDAVADLGTYLDGRNILLRYDPAERAWFRLTPRSTVQAGDRLLALPVFFPRITLASGVHLKLAGGTVISLADATAPIAGVSPANLRAPAVEVPYGQVVIVNTANDDNEVRLTLGATTADVRLVPGAALAVEVVPSYVPGLDPRTAPSPVTVQLYVREGEIEWADESGTQTIAAPHEWRIAAGVASPILPVESFPEWIDHEPVEQRSEQLYGAPVVERTLEPTRPADQQLLELYQSSRRREVKSLAARSSVYVGLFVPFVEALRDSEQRATWKMHIDTLRSAMALGPESAERIWQTLVDQRGEAAARDLYEMLCGYRPDEIGSTAEQVAAGPVGRLIGWIENDSLDYRVLAVQDLSEITGKRLMTNPAGSPTERALGVRRWQERLRSGELVPATP